MSDPLGGTKEDVGLSVDMLDVDRLRSWANLFEIHGNDISHWAQRDFVVRWLRELADRLDAAVRDIGALRATKAKYASLLAQIEAVERDMREAADVDDGILWWADRLAALRSGQ